MCAGGDDIMQSAVEIMYEYNEEEAVRDMCREREEAIAFEEFMKEEKIRLQAELEEVHAKLKQVEVTWEMIGVEKARLESDIERLETDNEQLRQEIERLKKMISN